MGYKGKYTPEVAAAVQEAAGICKEFGVPFGSPQSNKNNVEQRVKDGFLFMQVRPEQDHTALQLGLKACGRA
jgi:hypothetical protein